MLATVKSTIKLKNVKKIWRMSVSACWDQRNIKWTHFFGTSGTFNSSYLITIYLHKRVSAWFDIPRRIEHSVDDLIFADFSNPTACRVLIWYYTCDLIYYVRNNNVENLCWISAVTIRILNLFFITFVYAHVLFNYQWR